MSSEMPESTVKMVEDTWMLVKRVDNNRNEAITAQRGSYFNTLTQRQIEAASTMSNKGAKRNASPDPSQLVSLNDVQIKRGD